MATIKSDNWECKNKGSIIPYITVDGVHTYSPNKIAENFGKFYSTVGQKQSASILAGKKNIDHYLSQIPCWEKVW